MEGGILMDMLTLGFTSGPIPSNGYVSTATITLGATGITVRVNCLDYEATDVKVTDITSAPVHSVREANNEPMVRRLEP